MMVGREVASVCESGERLSLTELELDGGGGCRSTEGGSMLEDGFIRSLLKRHNSRSVLNTSLFAFLEETDIKEASLVCKLWFAEANSIETLQERYPIKLNRFSTSKRMWIWKCVLVGEDRYELYTEDRRRLESFRVRRESRGLGVSFESQLEAKLSNHEEILRDILRTFPKLKEFQVFENQNKMVEVLFKISYALPEVGYCQGMNYLVGIFLYALNFNVDQVYSSVMSILINWGYQEIYNKGLIKLREMCFVFNELIKECLPDIYNKVFSKENEIEVRSELFAIQWFLTLFTYDIADTEYAANSVLILDNIIIHDPNKSFNTTVYKIALSLLCTIFKDFNFERLDFNHNILEFVRLRSKEILINIDEIDTLLDMSRDLKVSEFMIQKIYTRYKRRIEHPGENDTVERQNKADESSFAGLLNNPRFSESSSLLKRFIVMNRYEDFDEFPSSFHPYFNI